MAGAPPALQGDAGGAAVAALAYAFMRNDGRAGVDHPALAGGIDDVGHVGADGVLADGVGGDAACLPDASATCLARSALSSRYSSSFALGVAGVRAPRSQC